MKKFGLAALGIIAGIVLLANLGSMVALAISALIAFAGLHYLRKSETTFAKVCWTIVLIIGLITSISNIPAFIGILALVGVYYVWRKWNDRETDTVLPKSDDPFMNFERQWDELTK